MIRQNFIMLIILLSIPFPAVLFGIGSKEKDSSDNKKTLLKNLDKHEEQWKNNGIKNYTEEIIYSRAAFPPECITITVSNNSVQTWTTNSGKKTFSEDFIESLTIENMFEKARKNFNRQGNSYLEFKISYNEELGYITNFSCIPASNENKNSAPLFDKNYRIEVISLKSTGADL